MAILQEASSKSNNPFLELVKDDLAPAGTWVATIIDIKDQFGVVRPNFDNPQVTEVVDLTTFLFGFRDQAGQPHRIASKTMRISGNEKSTLFGFLKAALGSAPKYGWDYCELKGKRCLLTVAHEQKRNGQGIFPTIAALCPVPTASAYEQGARAFSGASPAAGVPAEKSKCASPVGAPLNEGGLPAGGAVSGGQTVPHGAMNGQPMAAPVPTPIAVAPVDDEPLPF